MFLINKIVSYKSWASLVINKCWRTKIMHRINYNNITPCTSQKKKDTMFKKALGTRRAPGHFLAPRPFRRDWAFIYYLFVFFVTGMCSVTQIWFNLPRTIGTAVLPPLAQNTLSRQSPLKTLHMLTHLNLIPSCSPVYQYTHMAPPSCSVYQYTHMAPRHTCQALHHHLRMGPGLTIASVASSSTCAPHSRRWPKESRWKREKRWWWRRHEKQRARWGEHADLAASPLSTRTPIPTAAALLLVRRA
jgi:hypothetical protein